jgi:hypothetical protein
MEILHLTLKKKWFDMIASGEKKAEYRERKEYWHRRFTNHWCKAIKAKGTATNQRHFDIVRFRNGYAKNAPTMDVECLGIIVSFGNVNWGAAPSTMYYVIKLGEILSNKEQGVHECDASKAKQ